MPRWRLVRLTVFVAVALLLGVGPACAQRLTIAGFNVESGGADIQTVAKRVAAQKDVDIWGFSEVQSEAWAETLRAAVAEATGANARKVVGTTGGEDRLAVVFNDGKLERVRHFELRSVIVNACGTKTARAPLVVELKDRQTGRKFWFMVNHLQRGDNAYRHCQARTLNTWVKTNTVAMVAVGDYNFDWDIPTNGNQRDKGFGLLTAGDRFRWVKPSPPLIKSQCAFDSILDFVFATARARTWPASSKILFADEADYCQANPGQESDHRPMWGQFEMQ